MLLNFFLYLTGIVFLGGFGQLLNIPFKLVTFDVFNLDLSSFELSEEQLLGMLPIFFTFGTFQLEISGNEDNEIHL